VFVFQSSKDTALRSASISQKLEKANNAISFGIPDDVAAYLVPLGWDASCSDDVIDLADVFQVSLLATSEMAKLNSLYIVLSHTWKCPIA